MAPLHSGLRHPQEGAARPPGRQRVYIVEIKREHDRAHPVDGDGGRKALKLREWERLNPDRLRYEMIFASSDIVTPDQMRNVMQFSEEREVYLPISLDRERIAAYCRKWKIVELAFFGSVLRDDFRSDSDVDFLARFADDARWSLFDHVTMEEELAGIVGRKVDLVSRRAVEESENYIRRRHIFSTVQPYYVEG